MSSLDIVLARIFLQNKKEEEEEKLVFEAVKNDDVMRSIIEGHYVKESDRRKSCHLSRVRQLINNALSIPTSQACFKQSRTSKISEDESDNLESKQGISYSWQEKNSIKLVMSKRYLVNSL